MKKTTSIKVTENKIRQAGIIAIIRGNYPVDSVLRIAETLHRAGVSVMEITLNSSDALTAVSRLRSEMPDVITAGAGTVRTAAQTRQAINAGAQFLVSPNLDPESITYSRQADILHLPGVFTASEAQAAFAAGCNMVKLFPAHMLGPAYLKALRAPLDDISFVPTGGIDATNLSLYFEAGAVAAGIGSALVQNAEQSLDNLSTRAHQLVTALTEFRTNH